MFYYRCPEKNGIPDYPEVIAAGNDHDGFIIATNLESLELVAVDQTIAEALLKISTTEPTDEQVTMAIVLDLYAKLEEKGVI